MYDLQIIAPCVVDRLELFKKLGFYNIKNRKVLLYCLVQEDNEEFSQGWPENLDVEVIVYPYKNENFRVYKFLHDFDLEKANRARWTAKLDDDSYNNIDLLCSVLDFNYNYKKDFYIIGAPLRKEMSQTEAKILRKLNLLEKINFEWIHEYECCFVSQASMNKIVQNEDCKKIFFEFAKENELGLERKGYTDQMLAAAAKLCGINLLEDQSIKYEARGNDFEYILSFTHCHPVKYDNLIKIGKKLNKKFIIKVSEDDKKSNII